MRRVIVLIAVLLLALAGATTASAAGKKTATDTFLGTSDIPSENGALPAVVDWAHPLKKHGPNKSTGFNYVYTASGRASGTLPGSFTYVENGIVYLDLTTGTVEGNQYVSGTFTLTPDGSTQTITISDTHPAAYEYGTVTVDVSELQLSLSSLLSQIDVEPQDGKVTYGYFTFTDKYGTFKGYSTPDFTKFIIDITFDANQGDKHDK